MNAEQYDDLVVKIHKLYEEMYSVQERVSGNLDKRWRIFLTLGGVITHGSGVLSGSPRLVAEDSMEKIVEAFREWGFDLRDSYQIVCLYLMENYFGGNFDRFKQVRSLFRGDYSKAGIHLEDYINATNMGRAIPINRLAAHYVKMEKIRHNKWYKPFFKHKAYREYVDEAIGYFENHNISIHQALSEALRLGL